MQKSMRSTKGASKARRDHINEEIKRLRALLPISAEDQDRLSYLHSMSIICTFIRKSLIFTGVCEDSRDLSIPHEEILQAMPGFIVALTKDGKLVYVSENVSEYLGTSMVDVLQGDTFFQMIDTRDVERVKVILGEEDGDDVSAEKSFVCRMVTSKSFRLQYGSRCSMLVSGRFRRSDLFVALCRPTVNRRRDFQVLTDSTYFQTLHKPDMNFDYVPHSVFFHLGFSSEEMIGRSWYALLHPDDITLGAGLHKNLIEDDEGTEMVIRFQCKDLSWVWIYVWADMDVSKQVITCNNHIISETEALYLKQKLNRNESTSSSQSGSLSQVTRRSLKRRSERETQRFEPRLKSRRTSEENQNCRIVHEDDRNEYSTVFCTPPYSPTSSHSSYDFISEGYDALDLLTCDRGSSLDHFSPSSSSSPDLSSQTFPVNSLSFGPHSFSSPVSDVLHVPDSLLVDPPVTNVSECLFHPEDLDSFLLNQTHGRVYQDQVLTPESSPVTERNFHYDDEVSVLARQICSLAGSFDAYGAQTSGFQNWPHEREPVLDGRAVDGVLRDLDVVSGRERGVKVLPVAAGSPDQALCVDALMRFSSLQHLINTQNFYDINSDFHQLDLYGDVREDGLAEESMY